jgi:N-acetylmuramoyl-L-alanine amidase CwlD
MNRLRVRAGSALLLALALVVGTAPSVRAQTPPPSSAVASFWFAGTRLAFARPQLRAGVLAIASDDDGMVRFLAKLGATLSYQRGRGYVVVTTGDRRTITFALGDARYTVDGVAQNAPFAPYASDGGAYLPFLELARALYVLPVDDGDATVLEPQLAALDVQTRGRVTYVTLRGASPLRYKRVDTGDGRLALAFLGTATTLERERATNGPALRAVALATSGSPRNPTTVVTFDSPAGTVRALAPNESANALTLAFAPSGAVLGGAPIPFAGTSAGAATAYAPTVATPSPATMPQPTPIAHLATPAAASSVAPAPGVTPTPTALGLPAAHVTAIDLTPTDQGLAVHLAIAGDLTYEWHRLPDNRWYVDLKPAVLDAAGLDRILENPSVESVRVKGFVGPNDRLPTVRVAFSLFSPRAVTIAAESGGLVLAVDRIDDTGATIAGTGGLSGGTLVASIVPLPSPSALAPVSGDATPNPASTWKFSPPAATNAKLIVIDPGHGGSDDGAMHNGLVEKDLNLDISKRLRAILVQRGWQVKMTRETDVDVYQPNDSAHDELQARDDVASAAGARMFVSVHTNSFTSSSLNGTTTYYFTPASYALAQAVHVRLSAALPTKDDGIRKENFYVIHHATMPAILIETAFLSNPSDAALLKSPDFLQKVAAAIADGIGDYASTNGPLSAVPESDGR